MRAFLPRFALSLAIGAVMLYLAARHISLASIRDALAAADWTVVIPFMACMAAQHLCRSWRWGHLLEPITPVPFGRVLTVSSVGFLAIIALPLRMGEFVRPYLIADPPRLRMSQALGTCAVERVFDGLIMSLAAFAAVAIARTPGNNVPVWIFAAGVMALALFCVALIVLVMTLWQRDRAVSLCRRLVGVVSARAADRAASIATGIVDGFRVLPNARRLALFLGATVLYWFFNALSFWVMARGFRLDLTLLQASALVALIAIGIMIPAGPGFIGNFELFAQGALALYLPAAMIRERGGAFILAAHACNAGWYVIAGLIALFSRHARLTRVLHATTATPSEDPDTAPV